MEHKELSALIERYVITNNLKHTDFAVGGQAAKYLLGDCLQFDHVVDLAFRSCFVGQHPTVFEGCRFNCYRNSAEWASYHPATYSKAFVITTRHRIDKR